MPHTSCITLPGSKATVAATRSNLRPISSSSHQKTCGSYAWSAVRVRGEGGGQGGVARAMVRAMVRAR